MKYGTIEVKGAKHEAFINDVGEFYAVINGEETKADTLEGLKQKLMRKMALQKAKISIPFVRWTERGGLVRGQITGVHGRTRNLLVQFEDGKRDQEYSYSGSASYIKPEAADQLAVLGKARGQADKAYYDFVKAHQFNGHDEVRKLLAAQGIEAEE